MEKMAEVYNLKEQEYINKILAYESDIQNSQQMTSNMNKKPSAVVDAFNFSEIKALNETVTKYNDLVKYMIKLLFRLNEVILKLEL